MKKVGIEKLAIYPTTLSLDLHTLAQHRGYDQVNLQENLMVKQRSVNPLWEDPVTMAVNAASLLLSEEDKKDIKLLIVGTETGVDHEKTVSSWVHAFLELPSDCRNFEIKSACYSGTAGLKMALSWILANKENNKKALLITTDQSLIALGEPYEYITGAGAVAMLISDNPVFLEIEPEQYGVYSHEVTDVIRPLPWIETGNSEASLYSYMEALENSYDNFCEKVKNPDFNQYFNFNIYHVPFAGISFRAHKVLLQHDADYSKAEAWQSFTKKTLPSLIYPQYIGGTYGGSIFVALASLIKHAKDIKSQDRIGIFSYGSGSCAEFYSGLVGHQAQEIVNSMDIDTLLLQRYSLSVEEYEVLEKQRVEQIKTCRFKIDTTQLNHWYEQHYVDKHFLVLTEIKEYYRHYNWS